MQGIDGQVLDEKARRLAALKMGVPVRVTTLFYGPDLYGHPGTLVEIDLRSLYPYHVAVENVPGFPNPIVRSFVWYELEVR